MIERGTFSAKEVATLLGLSLASVYSATRCGLLPSLAVGVRRKVYPKAAILKILQNDTYTDNHSTTDKKIAAPFEVEAAQEDHCLDEDSAKTT